MTDIDKLMSSRNPDNVTLAFMKRVQPVYVGAETFDYDAAAAPRNPRLSLLVQPASTALVLTFIRPLDREAEKKRFERAFKALLRKRHLTPLPGGAPFFDDAEYKGAHPKLTARVPAAQTQAARALAFDLETATRQIHRQAQFNSRKFDI